MKLSPLILGASLLANAALVGLLVFQSTAESVSPSDLAAATSPAVITSASSTENSAAKKSPTTLPSSTKSWARLNTDDLSALVPRLRAAGFPAAAIRRIITSLVSERYDARRLEIEKANFDSPFWSEFKNPYTDPKMGPELRKMQREQTDELKKLLGGNLNDLFADTEENKALLRQQIGNVPPEKIDQLYAVAMAYNEKRAQIMAAAKNGALLNADREKMVEIEKSMRDDLGKFFTPAEVSDFMLHGSESSYRLRAMLSPIQPSEVEYRTIFPVYQAFQEQFPSPASALSPEQAALRSAAEDQMNAQIKGLLGPDRAADFQQANNPAYAQLNRLVARLELPIAAATQVAAVQTDIQERVAAVRDNRELSSAQRTAQIAALAQEATTKVSTTLGARGLEAYKQYGGQWLQNLAPRPTPAPKN